MNLQGGILYDVDHEWCAMQIDAFFYNSREGIFYWFRGGKTVGWVP